MAARGRVWRGYFAFLVLYLGASEYQAWRRLAEPTPTDVATRLATLAFAAVTLAGLYGFIRRRPLLRPIVWWLVLALLAAAAASSAAVLLAMRPGPGAGQPALAAFVFYLLPLLPLFYALARYAADRALWR
jgi:hypothetical protein